MKTRIKSILACISMLLMVSSCDKDKIDSTLPPKPERFSLQWDNIIDQSTEYSTDIFIGTQYIGIQGWPLVANSPYIYVGATFPKNAFATSFDREASGNKKPVELTFNFPRPYITGMGEVKRVEYLKRMKDALNSEEYKSDTPPTRPYILKIADLKSLANLECCFPENKNLN